MMAACECVWCELGRCEPGCAVLCAQGVRMRAAGVQQLLLVVLVVLVLVVLVVVPSVHGALPHLVFCCVEGEVADVERR